MANFFDQFDPPAEAKGGANFFDQFDPPEAAAKPQEPAGVPGQISIPGIGKPSIIGLVKGLFETGKSAATLPGDVYAGRVDPLSDEGIKRAADFAGLAQVGNLPSVARRQATAPLAAKEIETAARTSYDAIRDRTRAIALEEAHSQSLAAHVRAMVGEKGPRAKSAPLAHAEIDDLAKARDVGDLIESRQALAGIVREGAGPDIAAARMALRPLDAAIDRLAPDTSAALRTADKDYAIAKKSADIETKIKDAIDQERNQTLAGNRLKKVFEPMLEKGRDERMSAPVRKAVERASRPGLGPNLLRPFAAFDPTSRALGPMLSGLVGMSNPWALAAMPVGMGSRMMYDRIMKNRAAQVSPAMRAEAPATMAQPGYSAGGNVGLPPLRLPAPNPGLLDLSNDRPLQLTGRPQDAYR